MENHQSAGAGQHRTLNSPSEVFIDSLIKQVHKDDVNSMVESQKHMLLRFEKTNEMLLNFNSISTARFDATCQEFRKHTILLSDMKKDLDSVFFRIRGLKAKLSKHHPEAFAACSDVYNMMTNDDEEGASTDDAAAPAKPQSPDILTVVTHHHRDAAAPGPQAKMAAVATTSDAAAEGIKFEQQAVDDTSG